MSKLSEERLLKIIELGNYFESDVIPMVNELLASRKAISTAQAALDTMLSANFHSLLAATAWMGIPEKKRENFVETHVSNAKFICDKAHAEIHKVLENL